MTFTIGFIIGIIAGGLIGTLLMAMVCAGARDADTDTAGQPHP